MNYNIDNKNSKPYPSLVIVLTHPHLHSRRNIYCDDCASLHQNLQNHHCIHYCTVHYHLCALYRNKSHHRWTILRCWPCHKTKLGRITFKWANPTWDCRNFWELDLWRERWPKEYNYANKEEQTHFRWNIEKLTSKVRNSIWRWKMCYRKNWWSWHRIKKTNAGYHIDTSFIKNKKLINDIR